MFQFSHNDIKETALQTIQRTQSAKAITFNEFVKFVGKSEYDSLIESVGVAEGYFISQCGNSVFISIGNIDFIFTKKALISGF